STQWKEMVRVANLNDVILSIGHQRHYSMLYAHAVEVYNSGALGHVRHIRALWHRNNVPPRNDGWRPAIPDEDRAALAMRLESGEFDYKNMEGLVRWRLYRRTGGGLMAELGSHPLDACSVFVGKVAP